MNSIVPQRDSQTLQELVWCPPKEGVFKEQNRLVDYVEGLLHNYPDIPESYFGKWAAIVKNWRETNKKSWMSMESSSGDTEQNSKIPMLNYAMSSCRMSTEDRVLKLVSGVEELARDESRKKTNKMGKKYQT